MEYQFTNDMAEISGFGNGYEEACRAIVIRGLKWFDANPNKKPMYKGLKNVYGLCIDDNEDAKELDRFIMAGIDGTGAMHQACISHIFRIRQVGWETYVKESKEIQIKRLAETAKP